MKDILSSLKGKKFAGKKGVVLGGVSRSDEIDFSTDEFKRRPEIIEHLSCLRKITQNYQISERKPLKNEQNIDLGDLGAFKCPFCETFGDCTSITEHLKICLLEKVKSEKSLSIKALVTINDFIPLRNGIDILKKYLVNIITNPSEKKFKMVKTTNKYYISEVMPLKGHLEVLEYFGFVKQKIENPETKGLDDVFMMENPDIPHLKSCLKALDTKNQIYPILSRSLKKYFIKEDSQIPEDEKDLEITKEDLSSEYRRVREEAIERSQLKSRTTKSDSSQNKVVTLKIRTPDSSILQGCFYTDENVDEVFSFILSNLTDLNLEFVLQFHYVGVLKPGESRNKILLCDSKKISEYGINANTTLHLRVIGGGTFKDYLNDSTEKSFSGYNFNIDLE